MKTQTRWLFPFVMMFMVCVLVPDRALGEREVFGRLGCLSHSNGQHDLRGSADLDLENARQVFVGCSSGTFEPN